MKRLFIGGTHDGEMREVNDPLVLAFPKLGASGMDDYRAYYMTEGLIIYVDSLETLGGALERMVACYAERANEGRSNVQAR